MENEKLFEFMTMMYGEMKEGFKSVNVRLDGVENRLDGVENRLDKVENRLTKVETKIESMDDRLKVLAEVQQNHYEENQRNHKEIVEMLSGRLDTQEKVIKNITVVK